MSVNPIKTQFTGGIAHPGTKRNKEVKTEFTALLKAENRKTQEQSGKKDTDNKVSLENSKESREETKFDNVKKTLLKEKPVEVCNKGKGIKKDLSLPVAEDEKKIVEEFFGLLNQFISDLSLKIGREEADIREFMTENGLQVSELLDINTWKEFVVQMNGLRDVSEILTSHKAFDEFGMISNLLEEMMNSSEMGQMAAGMTEGGKEWKVFFDEFQELLPNLKEKIAELPKVEEGDEKSEINFGSEGDENLFLTLEDGKELAFESQREDGKEDGFAEGKTGEQPVGMGTKLFDRVVSEIREMDGSNRLPEGTTAREIINQVANQIKMLKAPDRTTLELMLQPASLGKVLIQVTSKNGIMQAELRVENEAAKAALENNIADLKTNFENQGFKVQEVEVMLSESGIGGNDSEKNGQEEGKKNKNKGNRKLELETEITGVEHETEPTAIKSSIGGESSVDYTA